MRENFTLRWSELLTEAVSRPGMMLEAYSRFHGYSIGNQIAALSQCHARKIEPGPIATLPKWRELGRHVRRGERALWLCMPVTVAKPPSHDDPEGKERLATLFIWRPRWFVLAQTEGLPYEPEPIPSWSKETALAALAVEEIPFTDLDGNAQGYAKGRSIAINPVAQLPWKTLFHELGHVLLEHTAQNATSDGERLAKNLREAEAEAVALICCDSLSLSGAEFCRGYIQEWLGTGDPIPEPSARRIFRTAEEILRAGSPPFTGTE
jgi:antirestriction protein ArdC